MENDKDDSTDHPRKDVISRAKIYDEQICENYDRLKEKLETSKETLLLQDLNRAFLCASYKGKLDCVKLLLENGADILTVDGNSDDALMLAISNGHKDIVEFLLGRGSPPNQANKFHYSPLIKACQNESVDLVKLLLKRISFKFSIKTVVPNFNATFLKYTYSNQSDISGNLTRLIKDLNKHKFMTYQSSTADTPLVEAVKKENIEIVKLLLEANVPVDETNFQKMTALHFAAAGNCPEIIKLLVASKANINALMKGNVSPLMFAVLNKKEDNVLELLKYGVDVHLAHLEAGFEQSVLSEAAKCCSRKAIEALCEAGANVDFTDNLNRTPLSQAAECENLEAIQFLIYYGCQLDTPTHVHLVGTEEQKTLLEIAVRCKNTEILKQLYTGGAFTNKVLYDCYLDENLTEICKDNDEMYETLKHIASSPMILKLMCRKTVRESIRMPLPQSVPKLKVPIPIQNFLLYSDLSVE